MAAPIVSWRSEDNSEEVLSWEVGTVDAGTPSDDFTVLVWNNYNGALDVSAMTDCTITTKDTSGGNTGDIIKGQWVKVWLPDANETVPTAVGGAVTHPIKATGNTVNSDGTFAADVGQILGVKNDGDMLNSKANYCKLKLRLDVPGIATAGNVPFLVRVSYRYV